MLGGIAKAIFGSSNDRYVKSLDKIVRAIAAFAGALVPMAKEFPDLAPWVSKMQAVK